MGLNYEWFTPLGTQTQKVALKLPRKQGLYILYNLGQGKQSFGWCLVKEANLSRFELFYVYSSTLTGVFLL